MHEPVVSVYSNSYNLSSHSIAFLCSSIFKLTCTFIYDLIWCIILSFFLKTKIRLIPCTTAQVQLRKVIKSIDNAKSVKYNEPHPPPPKQWKIILIIAYYMFYNIHFWYDYNLFKELILKNNTVELMYMNRELILFTINYSLKKNVHAFLFFYDFFFIRLICSLAFYKTILHICMY